MEWDGSSDKKGREVGGQGDKEGEMKVGTQAGGRRGGKEGPGKEREWGSGKGGRYVRLVCVCVCVCVCALGGGQGRGGGGGGGGHEEHAPALVSSSLHLSMMVSTRDFSALVQAKGTAAPEVAGGGREGSRAEAQAPHGEAQSVAHLGG